MEAIMHELEKDFLNFTLKKAKNRGVKANYFPAEKVIYVT
jgi:hypothetical protein